MERVDWFRLKIERARKHIADLETKPLWLLNELDNFDKHRLLITALGTMDSWTPRVVYAEATMFFDDRFVLMTPNAEVFRLPTEKVEKTGVENLRIPIEIVFEMPEIAKGKFVVGTLKEVADFLDNLVTKFERFLV